MGGIGWHSWAASGVFNDDLSNLQLLYSRSLRNANGRTEFLPNSALFYGVLWINASRELTLSESTNLPAARCYWNDNILLLRYRCIIAVIHATQQLVSIRSTASRA